MNDATPPLDGRENAAAHSAPPQPAPLRPPVGEPLEGLLQSPLEAAPPVPVPLAASRNTGSAARLTVAESAIETEQNPCRAPVEDAAAHWLDAGHAKFYQAICGSVAWFDGFFGARKFDQASAETFGRISVSGFWDKRNGFDQSLRLRARFALPKLKKRTALLIGRGDEKELIEGRPAPPIDAIPSNFNTVEDDAFLLGLGYSRNKGLERGFDFSIGAKVRWLPEPYVKASYRRAWDLSKSTLLSIRPLVYWRDEEGFGGTLGSTIDHLLSPRLMLRLGGTANVSEDREVEGVAWATRLSLFQAFNNRRALTYGITLHGETKSPVPMRSYGADIRYRQRVLRKWLFLEMLSSISWPQEFPWEKRETNVGFGVGIQMYFGPIPDAQMR